MTGVTDTRAARELRRLVERVGRLERQIRSQARASQARNRSVEGGRLEVYDEDGVLRSVVGDQGDGSYTIRDHNGPIPQAPGSPDVTAFPGGLLVSWDGTFEGDDPLAAPADFAHVEVHAGAAPGYDATDDTQKATLPNRRGGTAAVALDPTSLWYVSLVTVTTSGKESVKSLEVLGEPGDGGGPRFEADDKATIAAGDLTAGTVTLALSHVPILESLTAYWCGLWQKPANYTIDYDAQTLTWPLSGHEHVGDELAVHYAYREGFVAPPPPPFVAPTLVVDPATNPNVFFIPASLTTYSSTGIGAEGHGVTDLGHVGSVNYPDANFQGSNRGKGGPYPGLPSRVPGMRFFIVGDWSEPHSFSEKIPYGMWEDAPEGGPPNFQLFYSSQLWSNRDGRELSLVTIAGTGLPAGTVRGIEVWSDNGLGETSAVSGLRNGTTNVQVTAWGTPRTKPGVHARQWAVDITGVVLIYPDGTA